MNILENGTVLEVPKLGATQYWKIIGTTGCRTTQSWNSYSVIRCSKTGKEFRERNGFDIAGIDDAIKKGEVRVVANSEVGEKANIDIGIIDGVRKRRIKYLKVTIESMQLELDQLEEVGDECG